MEFLKVTFTSYLRGKQDDAAHNHDQNEPWIELLMGSSDFNPNLWKVIR